jgi:hypothetical protein
MFEFGTSRAAAWDCPVTVMEKLEAFKTHPRTADILEVMRRWEDVRAKKWLTEEQKLALQDLEQEHILLINESGEYELVAYDQITGAAGGSKDISAFIFERKGERCVVFWHTSGSGKLALPLEKTAVKLQKELGGASLRVSSGKGVTTVPVGDRCYLSSSLSREKLIEAVESARMR